MAKPTGVTKPNVPFPQRPPEERSTKVREPPTPNGTCSNDRAFKRALGYTILILIAAGILSMFYYQMYEKFGHTGGVMALAGVFCFVKIVFTAVKWIE